MVQDRSSDLSMLVVFSDSSNPNPSDEAGVTPWDFGDGSGSSELNPMHEYQSAENTYDVTLTVENKFHCFSTARNSITLDAASIIYIPNAFTPDNGDGINTTFRPYFVNLEELQVQIFNRWGEQIAGWSHPDGSWDGRFKGRPAEPGVYVYRIQYKDIHDKEEELVGNGNPDSVSVQPGLFYSAGTRNRICRNNHPGLF